MYEIEETCAAVVASKKLEEEERKCEELLVTPRSHKQSRSTSCGAKILPKLMMKLTHVEENARPIFGCEDLSVV